MVLEKTLESPLDCKEIQPVRPKGDQSWVFIGRTDAEAETPILWPPDAKNWLWCWKRLKAGEWEGDDWRWDGWMASPTWWTWVWASSGSWWWTGMPGVLQSMGLQRVGHDWGLNWTENITYTLNLILKDLVTNRTPPRIIFQPQLIPNIFLITSVYLPHLLLFSLVVLDHNVQTASDLKYSFIF